MNSNTDINSVLIQLCLDNGIIKKITKNNKSFLVIDNYQLPDFCPNGFFENHINNGGMWENNTFQIIDYYSNPEGIFIDIGAWLGPFSLYSSKLFKEIYAFEPDRIAFQSLSNNISLNSFDNITLIEKALADKTGKSDFGGNGDLGNSESTLLVRDIVSYCKNSSLPGQRGDMEYRYKDIIEVDTITIEDWCKHYNINIFNISLIKIDIEGSEYIVIPAIQNFLRYIKPTLYISIHWCFLQTQDIIEIIDILFEIYPDRYVFTNNTKYPISKENILQNKITDILLED